MRSIPELVLVFHRHSALESRLQEHCDELGPVNQPLAGNAITPPAFSVDADFRENRLDDFRVLRVHGENPIAEVPGRLDRINVLPNEVGRVGGKVEPDVIAQGTTYYGKEKDSVSVVMPLRDRNGDPVAAVRVIMKPFAGQTEQSAYSRALPIIREMQGRVASLQDLVQ